MNSDQRKALQVLFVIIGCFGIYTYTAVFSPVIHYCDYTGLQIQGRIGHEVTFEFLNGTSKHYCCVNISLLTFQSMKSEGILDQLNAISVRCPMCGMLMAWDDPMIVWIYSSEYLNPTTNEATIVPLCEDASEVELCESHFIEEYGGIVIASPYVWT